MWIIDLDIQKKRGFFQGFHRGLYKDYDYDIPERCFWRESTKQIFYIELIYSNL